VINRVESGFDFRFFDMGLLLGSQHDTDFVATSEWQTEANAGLGRLIVGDTVIEITIQWQGQSELGVLRF
jgi:hypothetical protein